MLGFGSLGLVALGRAASGRVVDALAAAAVVAVCASSVTVIRPHSAAGTATGQATQSSWLFVYQPSTNGTARAYAANTVLRPYRVGYGAASATAVGRGITIENVYAAGDAQASAFAEGIAGGTNAYGDAYGTCASSAEFHQLRMAQAAGSCAAAAVGGGIGIYIVASDTTASGLLHSEAQVNDTLDAYGDALADVQVIGREWLNLRTSANAACTAIASGSHQYGSLAAASCAAGATGDATIRYAILGSASLAGAASLSDDGSEIYKDGFPGPVVAQVTAYGYPKRQSAGFSDAVGSATLTAAYQRNRFGAGDLAADALGVGGITARYRQHPQVAPANAVGTGSARPAVSAGSSLTGIAATTDYWMLAIRAAGTANGTAGTTEAVRLAARAAGSLISAGYLAGTGELNRTAQSHCTGSATAVLASFGLYRDAASNASVDAIADAFPMVNVLSSSPALYTLYVQSDLRVVIV